VTTGVSAAERAATVRALVDTATRPADLVRPGHVLPLRAADGGLRERRGHTEAAVELCRLAGLEPAAVIVEVMNPDGTMARRPELAAFAAAHDLPLISIGEIVGFLAAESGAPSPVPPAEVRPAVVRVAESALPTEHGRFRMVVYGAGDGPNDLALIRGEPAADGALVRVHSECLTGDVLGSLRCDCGPQLNRSLATIAAEGSGILVYLRQEGRGIGLANKARAYALQDAGLDTVDANLALGFPADLRDYDRAGAILVDLGVDRVRLLTNNPAKVRGLEDAGVAVLERRPLEVVAGPENAAYLATKRVRLGHVLEGVR
jgi:3,4-dihydroxy 2-butanone 4-phosphate synthase/GTP cyclohydrolase II